MSRSNGLTDGNVLTTLIRFAVPVLAAMFLQSLYGGVDLLVVGQFSQTADVSGVSTGSLLVQTVTMIVTGLSMGTTVLVGRKIGERNPGEAGKAVGSGILCFAVLALILTLLMVGFTDPLAALLHTPAEAYQQTCMYIRICGAGMFFVVMYNLLGAVFRGLGDSATPLITVCIACVINIVGDLFFVAVLGMGAAGAAIATVLAQAISVLCSVWIISRKELPFAIRLKDIRFHRQYTLTQLQLGLPIALQEFLVGLSFVVIQTVVNSRDVIASAGVGVAEKVCGFIMLVPSAFSQSISAFVAQNIGAGREDRAVKALKYGIAASLGIAVVIASFAFVRGDLLAGIFSRDPAVILQAHDYLKAYAIDTLLVSIMFCFVGYFNGRGNTFFVMAQGLVGAVLVRIPVVLFVNGIAGSTLFHLGLSNPVSTVVQILLCVVYYRRTSRTLQQI